MYIGSTAKERPDHFVVIESGDSATEILALMKENRFSILFWMEKPVIQLF